MTITQFINDYGYFALALGCLLEGETVLLLAGLMVHRGLLSGPLCLGIAILFGFMGDQFWFWMGHRYGSRLLARFPALQARLPELRQRFFSHPDLLVLGIRFMVGLRTAGPILMGSGLIEAKRFVWLNLLGAILWAASVLAAGYAFGQVVQNLLPEIHRAEEAVVGLLLLVGLGIHIVRHRHRRTSHGTKEN